jgi:hypothetical protein
MSKNMAIEITYNSITKRDVRGFTLVFEALQVLFIAAFIYWCRTSCNNVAHVTNLCLLASKRAFRVLLLELVYDL